MAVLNAKDAILEVLSDGKPRTVPEIITALLDMDRVWFRNLCRSAVSSKCCDLERDGLLIRAGFDCSRSSSQPYVIWGLKEAERYARKSEDPEETGKDDDREGDRADADRRACGARQ